MPSRIVYEVLNHEGERVCMCGTEEDARMMMNYGYNRSWIKKELFEEAIAILETPKVLE